MLEKIPEVQEKPTANDFELELASLEKEIQSDASKRGGFCWENDTRPSKISQI